MAVTQALIISGVSDIKWVKDSAFASANDWDTTPVIAAGDKGIEAESPTSIGGILTGTVTLEFSSEQEKIDVEQDTIIQKHLLKAEGATVKFQMAEASLANMQLGIPGMATPGSGIAVFGPISTTSATSTLHHYSLLIVATGNTTSKPVRRICIPKCYMTGNMSVGYTKGGVQAFEVEFSVARAQETSGTGNLVPAVYILDSATLTS